MATFGNSCINRAAYIGGDSYTFIDRVNPATENGTVTEVCVYMAGATPPPSGKAKIFRLNSSNYDFIGQSSSQVLSVGLNTFTGLSIDILNGDYVGLWIEGQWIDYDSGPSNSNKRAGGDVITSLPVSSWTEDGAILSIQATYTPGTTSGRNHVFINSSTGDDSNPGNSCVASHPVQTFGTAYDLLTPSGMIHVCNDGADFSGETVILNKSFSIDRNTSDLNNATGSFYMPKAS